MSDHQKFKGEFEVAINGKGGDAGTGVVKPDDNAPATSTRQQLVPPIGPRGRSTMRNRVQRADAALTRARLPAVLTMTCLLGGCATNLAVQPFKPMDAARAGAVHVLPYTFYKLDVTWRVTSCDVGKEDVGVKVTAESAEADDAAQAYIIDPTSLQTLLSISSFKVVYADGQNRLESISASVEDRTGPTIVNFASGLAGIAKAGLGLAPPAAAPGGPRVAPTPPRISACRPVIIRAVQVAKDRKAELASLNDQVDAATAEVTSLAARVAMMGGAVDDETKRKFAEALKALEDLQGLQATKAALLAQALKPISYTLKHEWPKNSGEFSSNSPLTLPNDVLDKWFDPAVLRASLLAQQAALLKAAGRTDVPPEPTLPAVSFQLERVGSFGHDPVSGSGASAAPTRVGLRYRTPAHGRLVVCQVTPCASSRPDDVLTTLEGPVAQLGYVNVLPVKTRAFGSTTFNAEYGPGGALKSAGYEQKAAPLEGVSSTFKSVAGEISPLILANQPTQKLAAETAKLEALKKKRDAEAALAPAAPAANQAALDALGADTTLLDAQISNLQARVTLADLQAKLSQ